MTLPLKLHGVWDGWGIVFDPIPFTCSDGRRKIRCRAALDALAMLCPGVDLAALDDPELADLFAETLDTFVAIASFKYDAGALAPDGSIIIKVDDVRPMARSLGHR